MNRLIGVGILIATVAHAGEALGPTADVMKELLRIEAASFHPEAADRLRIEFTTKARERPTEAMPRVWLAWLTLPSDDAWNQLKALAPLFPDNPWVHYGMGRIYVKWKMGELARAELNQVLKRDPKFYPALTALGDLAAQGDQPGEAEALYRQAIAIAPDPLAQTGLGLALLKAGKSAEATEALKASTHAYPEQPAALTALVPLLTAAKDPAVLETASALCELRPKDREARTLLANLKLESGDKAGAIKEYEKAVRLGNPEPATLTRLASLYREQGSADEEERVEQSLASLEASVADHNLRVAELRAAKHDLRGAELQYLEAIKRDPKLTSARLALAKLQHEAGLDYQAVEQLRAAKANDPSNTEVSAQLDPLESSFKLGKHPLRGNVNGIYWALTASLDKLYAERRAARPALAGKIKLRAKVAETGRATEVEVIEDTVKDPVLVGHLYFGLRDAEYAERKRVEPVIEFELGAAKKGK